MIVDHIDEPSVRLGEVAITRSRAFWWALASAGLMVVGAFGPWFRAFIFTVSGVDGDGQLVVVAAGLAAAALYQYRRAAYTGRRLLIVVLASGLSGVVVVAYDAIHVLGTEASGDDLFGGADLISPSWGLFVAGASSASLICASAVLFAMGRASARVTNMREGTQSHEPSERVQKAQAPSEARPLNAEPLDANEKHGVLSNRIASYVGRAPETDSNE